MLSSAALAFQSLLLETWIFDLVIYMSEAYFSKFILVYAIVFVNYTIQ